MKTKPYTVNISVFYVLRVNGIIYLKNIDMICMKFKCRLTDML